jgi:hypothetical protein
MALGCCRRMPIRVAATRVRPLEIGPAFCEGWLVAFPVNQFRHSAGLAGRPECVRRSSPARARRPRRRSLPLTPRRRTAPAVYAGTWVSTSYPSGRWTIATSQSASGDGFPAASSVVRVNANLARIVGLVTTLDTQRPPDGNLAIALKTLTHQLAECDPRHCFSDPSFTRCNAVRRCGPR